MVLWLPACLLDSSFGLERPLLSTSSGQHILRIKKQEQMLGEMSNKSDVQDSSAAWNPSLSNLAAEGFPEVKIMPGSPLTAL